MLHPAKKMVSSVCREQTVLMLNQKLSSSLSQDVDEDKQTNNNFEAAEKNLFVAFDYYSCQCQNHVLLVISEVIILSNTFWSLPRYRIR